MRGKHALGGWLGQVRLGYIRDVRRVCGCMVGKLD